jgi:hypothetical protein
MTTKHTTPSVITTKDLLQVAGVENVDDLIQMIRLAKTLTDTLQNGKPVGFYPVTNGNRYLFKCLDFPLGDWLRYSGQISKDFYTPLEALDYFVKSTKR